MARHYEAGQRGLYVHSNSVIAIQCYECGTRTMIFDESHRMWHCNGCCRALSTDEAVNEIHVATTDPRPARGSIWQSVMSGTMLGARK